MLDAEALDRDSWGGHPCSRLCGGRRACCEGGVVWMGWGARCAGCARWERGRGLAKKPATPRPAMRAHVRAGGFLGKGGAQGLFFGRLFWHRNEGSVYTGFGAMGSTRHLGSRVWGVCFCEYDCNPAAPPSGPGSLAGRAAAARTALRKTHIERTTHHTHHAPRTHPPLSKRLLCPAKRAALSLPRRTHARRAKSRRSRAAGGVGREPPEREARSTSGFRG